MRGLTRMGTKQPGRDRKDREAWEKLALSESLQDLMEECRMVLPGIQALFGFQLIAIFNQGFADKLAPWQRQIHLAAVVLIVIAIALIMAPASLHRQAEQDIASERLLRLGSRLLVGAMIPLSIAICLEVFVVAGVILRSTAAAAALALVLQAGLIGIWFVFPVLWRARRQG